MATTFEKRSEKDVGFAREETMLSEDDAVLARLGYKVSSSIAELGEEKLKPSNDRPNSQESSQTSARSVSLFPSWV